MCVWGGGVSVKDGVPLALYCSQHTLAFTLKPVEPHRQRKQRSELGVVSPLCLYTGGTVCGFTVMQQIQIQNMSAWFHKAHSQSLEMYP